MRISVELELMVLKEQLEQSCVDAYGHKNERDVAVLVAIAERTYNSDETSDWLDRGLTSDMSELLEWMTDLYGESGRFVWSIIWQLKLMFHNQK